MLQSATVQDSGPGNQSRTNARVLVYDISGGAEVPTDPVEQYVVQLPRIDSDLNGTLDRAGAQSGILALDNDSLLILSRDGNCRGPGVATGAVFKSVLLADLSTGSNIDGLYDAAGADLTPSGDILAPTITAVEWSEALNMLGKVDLNITELEQFGLNLLGNDFQTSLGLLTLADGTSLAYDAGLSNDTMLLAFRVTIAPVPVPGAVWLFGSAVAGLAALRRRSGAVATERRLFM